jgi:hypothetical protein
MRGGGEEAQLPFSTKMEKSRKQLVCAGPDDGGSDVVRAARSSSPELSSRNF